MGSSTSMGSMVAVLPREGRRRLTDAASGRLKERGGVCDLAWSVDGVRRGNGMWDVLGWGGVGNAVENGYAV
jgi:hypothetical protein